MKEQAILEKAVEIIRRVSQGHQVRVERILLFGSRARGQAQPESDWDFYVLVDRDLTFAEKRSLVTLIKRELAQARIPNDVILKSIHQFRETRNHVGYLAHEVQQEGIAL
jgi:predicted nucleotidyltransferase